jgi:hypothetical protein
MNRRTLSRRAAYVVHSIVTGLVLLPFTGTVFSQTANEPKAQDSSVHVTHILGFEGVSKGATGDLSVAGDSLQFQKTGGSPAKVSLASIQDVLLGVQDRQVGGTPMMLGKAAVPFGGGRAIGLFSHKKYDVLTLEYLDANGGFHGAVFELPKGKAEALKTQLVAGGAHASKTEEPAAPANPEVKNEKQ